jgi:hypothetical protein
MVGLQNNKHAYLRQIEVDVLLLHFDAAAAPQPVLALGLSGLPLQTANSTFVIACWHAFPR